MKSRRIVWGLALIGLGALLMLERMGLLPKGVDVWGLFLSLFLIAIGLSWILSFRERNNIKLHHMAIPKGDILSASIVFDYGAGELIVRASESDNLVVDGDFSEGVESSSHIENQVQKVNLKSPYGDQWTGPFGGVGLRRWDVRLAKDLPLSLVFNNGANSSNLDLKDLLVQSLQINTGASSTEISMPALAGETTAVIKAGAASVRIQIPEGVAARITTSGAIASVEIDPKRFPREGGSYVSPDYMEAENRIDLRVECGVGSINIY